MFSPAGFRYPYFEVIIDILETQTPQSLQELTIAIQSGSPLAVVLGDYDGWARLEACLGRFERLEKVSLVRQKKRELGDVRPSVECVEMLDDDAKQVLRDRLPSLVSQGKLFTYDPSAITLL